MDKTISLEQMEEKMTEYLDCTENRDYYVGADTAECMAKAALAVLSAVKEVQHYALKEGYVKEDD